MKLYEKLNEFTRYNVFNEKVYFATKMQRAFDLTQGLNK